MRLAGYGTFWEVIILSDGPLIWLFLLQFVFIF